MKPRYLPTIIAAFALTICQSAEAQNWDETLDGGGDAFDLPPGQITIGSGPLLSITGAISNPDFDVDMYCITIDDPDNFSATVTVGSSQEIAQLWLFDQSEFGVAHSVDALASGGFTTTLSGPFTTAPPPGTFFLAISRRDLDPLDIARNPLFTPNNPTGQIDPDPLAGPLDSWNIPFGNGIPGPYTINLVGATFHGVPEPASAVILAIGLFSVLGLRKRNCGQKRG